MEAFTQLPHRLTKLYTDTKHAGAAAVEPEKTETIPEFGAVHRKFRIQTDRLLAWGVDWGDRSASSKDDIEEEVMRAGLTDNVSSVLATIKAIFEEAERMQNPVELGIGQEKAPSKKRDTSSTDVARYEDLAKDLTSAVDILYGLSRSRQAMREGNYSQFYPSSPNPSATLSHQPTFFSTHEQSPSDLALVPTTGSTITHKKSLIAGLAPVKLDPASLILPEEEPPPYENIVAYSVTRLIGHLRETRTSTNPWKIDGGKLSGRPILVEYAAFDPVYTATGVSPPLDRLNSLLSILTRMDNEPHSTAAMRCVGYFEDPNQPRFGLVYELPAFVYSGPTSAHNSWNDLRPATLLSVLQASKTNGPSPTVTPPLEERFKLALSLAQTFARMHSEDFVHKDVSSNNILIFRQNARGQLMGSKPTDVNLRSPFVCSFDLFSDSNVDQASTLPSLNIYRHPQDPRAGGSDAAGYGPQYDLYSLGLVLLEIGLWLPISDLFKTKYTLADFKQRVENIFIKKLAGKCGTTYMHVVRDCLALADRLAPGAEAFQSCGALQQVYTRVLIRLQRCCLLDESEPMSDFPSIPGAPIPRTAMSTPRTSDLSIKIPGLSSATGSKHGIRRFGSERRREKTEEALRTFHTTNSTPNFGTLDQPPPSQHMFGPNPFSDGRHSLSISPTRSSGEHHDHWDTSSRKTSKVSYREKTVRAASVIQGAWRAHKDKISFQEYKRKVTIVQMQWRLRKARLSSRFGSIHLPHSSRSPIIEEVSVETRDCNLMESSIRIETYTAPPKQKLRVWPAKFSPTQVTEWHQVMLPQLERIVERVLKDSDETVSIDLVAIGESQTTIRPTIIITCTSTSKVRAVITRKFSYDKDTYDLKVRKGKIRRSKMDRAPRRRPPPHRSMVNEQDVAPLNPFHQQRPLCGASIGAFKDQHLPPVSYGGVILVDGEPLGMSVHHLLDAPSEDDDDEYHSSDGDVSPGSITRSSAREHGSDWLMGTDLPTSVQPPQPQEYSEISDYDESDVDDYEGSLDGYSTDSEDDYSDIDSEAPAAGDIEGVYPGDGEDIIITQPALDDVDEDFFPCIDDRDEDHIESHALGHVHASSGIRRWRRNDILHEIDWSLIKLDQERIQPYNLIQGGKRFHATIADADSSPISARYPTFLDPICRRNYSADDDEYPYKVAKADDLGGLKVHCFGRTSGLQGGTVGSVMSSVKIYRRRTFSRSWHVVGSFGVGGDSGAWIIDNDRGRICGHVLAWCEKTQLAYICPMEVLLEDIKRTLRAGQIRLPGSDEAAVAAAQQQHMRERAGSSASHQQQQQQHQPPRGLLMGVGVDDGGSGAHGLPFDPVPEFARLGIREGQLAS